MGTARYHWFLLATIVVAVSIAFAAGGASRKVDKSVTKSAEKIEHDPDLATRQSMIQISKQLGVTCTHCHDPNNFKSHDLPTWNTAKEHMRVTQVLNSKQGFGGSPKVDCFTCHQGVAKPKNSSSISASLPEPKKKEEIAP
jgi:hypothetical protein